MKIQRVGFRLCITNTTQKKRLTVLNLIVGMWVTGLIPTITSFPKQPFLTGVPHINHRKQKNDYFLNFPKDVREV